MQVVATTTVRTSRGYFNCEAVSLRAWAVRSGDIVTERVGAYPLSYHQIARVERRPVPGGGVLVLLYDADHDGVAHVYALRTTLRVLRPVQ